MTRRQTPPGRTSIWWMVFVKPFGPHHWAMCLGSVQTSKTNSRGASSRRVRTISRSAAMAESLLFSVATVILLLLGLWSRDFRPDSLWFGLQFTKVLIQTVQSCLPEAAIVV